MCVVINMKTAQQLAAACVLACIVSSCAAQPPGEEFVHQKIPIEIQSGKTVTVEIHLSYNGPDDVGIRCPPEVWNALTNGTRGITARLKSSDDKNTKIYGVNPGGAGGYFLNRIPNVYYLFEIHGGNKAKASVEITFPNAPAGITHAEIIVGKTPEETEGGE
jgi:hypothetical protein